MHHALQLDELVRLILRDLDFEESAAMSRVSKRLGNMALDVLWESTDIEKLLHLFPPGIVSDRTETFQKEFVKFPLDRDWERYAFYAPRVRTLFRTYRYTIGAFVNFQNVLPILRDRGGLPNLQRLNWTRAKSHEFPDICMFIVPSLKSVILSDDNIFSSGPVDLTYSQNGLMFHQQVEAPLQKLIGLRISLHTLKLPVPIRWTEHPEATVALYESKFTSLQVNSLVDVEVFASNELVRFLSTIPTLKALALRHYPAMNTSQANCDISEAFPSLLTLRVDEAMSLRDVTTLMRVTGCVPSSSLFVTIIRFPSGYKVSQLLDALLSSGRSRSIQEFELVIDTGHRYNDYVQVDEDDDLFRNGLATLDHFRPLLPSDMHRFCLDLGYSLCVSDEQLKEFVSAWPMLEVLSLRSKSESDRTLSAIPTQNTASLYGLKHLASLGSLIFATIEVKINSDAIPTLTTETASTSPLNFLNLERSNIEPRAIKPLGYYLAHLFPKLTTLGYEGDEDELDALEEDEDLDDPSPGYRVIALIREVHEFNRGTPDEGHPAVVIGTSPEDVELTLE